MDFTTRILGRTGLKVGRMGVAASYGAPAEAFEEAFDHGCNYFYWGFKHKPGLEKAVKNLCGQGKRDDLVIVIQSYSRSAALMEIFYRRALAALNIERGDVLLLGWHRKRPSRRLIDRALEMKEKGLFRFLAVSGHNRPLFPILNADGHYDLFHIRYNAAHRGAAVEAFPYLTGENRPGIVTYTATRWGHLLQQKKMPPGESPPPARDCYRFVMSNPAVDICLTGPRDVEQMREALKALELGPLNEEETVRMEKIGDFVRSKSKGLF